MALNPLDVPNLNELYVYVTNGCNCACRHCYIIAGDAAGPGGKTRFIDPQLLDRAIGEALPLGLAGLKWTGGEPTIHPDFPGLLAIQQRHGLAGRMETNGMAVTPRLADQLMACGVDDISVSLDGATAVTHDRNRNVDGGFELTLAGIRALRGAGYRPELILSLLRGNLDEIEAFLDLAGELGAGAVKFNIVQPALRGAELHAGGEVPSVAEILALQRRLTDEWQARYDFPIYLDLPLAFRPLREMFQAGGLSRCGILGILGLLADGHYALCGVGEHERGLVFGPAGCGELETIWREHPVLQRLRDELPKGLKGICGRCLMRDACLGSCVAANFQQGRDLLAGFWFCELALEEGLFPAGRRKA